MTPIDRAVSEVVGSMLTEDDVASTLARLVRACCAAYPSDSVAVMAVGGDGELELLSSSTHGIEGIELLQIQNLEGPCADVVHSDRRILVSGEAALLERWPKVGRAIVEAGFTAAHAFPMRWRGDTIGGLNIFLRSDAEVDEPIGQLFADLATLAVLHSHDLSADQLVARVHRAVAARAVIERAKGVLSETEGMDIDRAHQHLVEVALSDGRGISAVAEEILAGAYPEADD